MYVLKINLFSSTLIAKRLNCLKIKRRMLNNAAAAKLKPKTPTQTTERGNPCKLTCLSKAGVIRDEKAKQDLKIRRSL